MKVFKNNLVNCYDGGTVVVAAETAYQANEYLTEYLEDNVFFEIKTDVGIEDVLNNKIEDQIPVFPSDTWEEIQGVESNSKTPKVLIYQVYIE